MINLKRLPFAVSQNSQYLTIGRRRIKSPERRQFDRAIYEWTLLNREVFQEAKSFLKSSKLISAKFEICAERSAYLTKMGTPKIVDLDNRLKCFDALFELLDFNDAHIWSLSAIKKIIPDSDTRHVNIELFEYLNK